MISKKKISYYQQFKRVCLGCFLCYFVREFAVKACAYALVGALDLLARLCVSFLGASRLSAVCTAYSPYQLRRRRLFEFAGYIG